MSLETFFNGEHSSQSAGSDRFQPTFPSLEISRISGLTGLADRDLQIAEIRRVLETKGLKIGLQARLAVLNAGRLREQVASASPDRRMLDILHKPEPLDPSHAGIFGLRRDDRRIGELIAEVVQDVYPANPA